MNRKNPRFFPHFLFWFFLFLTLGFSLSASVLGVDSNYGQKLDDLATANDLATSVHSATGLAVSPGLVLFGRGLYGYLAADDRSQVPWHSSGSFLLIAGAVLLLFLSKDFLPFEPLQKLLAAAEEGVMGLWGLLAYALSVPGLASIIKPTAQEALNVVGPWFFTAAAQASDYSAGGEYGGAAGLLAAFCGTIVYWVIWCVSNSINVLCLLAPSLAAPVLKGFRALLTGTILGLGAIHPLLGLLASIIVIVISIVLVRWSFKLTVWGLLFSFDLVFRRWRKPDPPSDAIWAFASGRAKKTLKIPKRTFGRLVLADDGLFFYYRRFLLFKTRVTVDGPYAIGHRLTAPTLAIPNGQGGYSQLFSFRLSLKGHEEFLKRALGASSIEEMGILKGTKKAWAWLRDLVSHKNPDLIPI
ncbi:MAG: hypothetical protein LBS60_14125 [Deltaproteobacteria bacterium]|jgi:hypothetical protein|nr:hypothetical protein [Deltaproteobacteria bacterium]